MLDGLALAGLGALGDGAGDEEDELAGGAPLEVPEVAHVRGVRQHHRLGARLAVGRRGGAPGAGGRRLQHEECRNLHLSQGKDLQRDAADLAAAAPAPRGDGWVGWTEAQPRKKKLPFPPLLDSVAPH